MGNIKFGSYDNPTDADAVDPGSMRVPVLAFASLMEHRLREHDSTKGSEGWLDAGVTDLLECARDQVCDVGKILDRRDAGCSQDFDRHELEAVSAAVDGANYLMMVASVLSGLPLVAAGYLSSRYRQTHEAEEAVVVVRETAHGNTTPVTEYVHGSEDAVEVVRTMRRRVDELLSTLESERAERVAERAKYDQERAEETQRIALLAQRVKEERSQRQDLERSFTSRDEAVRDLKSQLMEKSLHVARLEGYLEAAVSPGRSQSSGLSSGPFIGAVSSARLTPCDVPQYQSINPKDSWWDR